MRARPSLWVSLVVAVAACAALWAHERFVPRIERLGGIRLTYVVSGDARPEVLRQTSDVLGRRAAGLRSWRDMSVRTVGERIVLDVAAVSEHDIEEARAALSEIGELQFKRVDDDVDFFQPVARSAAPEDLPRGLRFQIENAPIGPGRTQPVHYALLIRGEDEDQRAALARFRQWVATLPVPADREIGFEPYFEHDENTDRPVEIGWRTFLLFARPELGGAAVHDAMARPEAADRGEEGWFVSIEFTPEGGRRFEELTASNVKRRFAILVDGVIQSAPVIQSAIRGRYAQITLGAGTVEAQLRDARRLEVVLRSGALPVPIALESSQRIERSTALYAAGAALPAVASLSCIVFFALLAHDRARRRRARGR